MPSNLVRIGFTGIVVGLFLYIFNDGLAEMVKWWDHPEYNHGYAIPLIAIYLLWNKAAEYRTLNASESWMGVGLVLFGLFGFFAGELSAIYVIVQYSFLITLWGFALTAVGWQGVRVFWAALLYLVFMVPLPRFFEYALTSELQLISSVIGSRILQAIGVTVHLEGNIIDLGIYKLQVVEACSGLRYLFPLMSLGFLFACLYRAALWKRILVVISTVPITLFMNSFRIAVIGLLVNRYGTEAADGFLHFFEGWIIFMACIAILLFEMWALGRIGADRNHELFAVEIPPLADLKILAVVRNIRAPLATVGVLLIAGALVSAFLADRKEAVPERTSLAEFPLVVADWLGKTGEMGDEELRVLKLTDYLINVYQRSENDIPVELYVAYYDSQRKGASAHSPRACIPGSGWRITEFSQIDLADVLPDGSGLPVNRVLISMADTKILVYYLFMQRGRFITNEYLVKWYIFWDSITKNRTDGALVRVMTPVGEVASVNEADRRLQDFLRAAHPRLSYFIPQEDGILASREAAIPHRKYAADAQSRSAH